MKIAPFKLERYFAKYEFTAPYLLSCSDCEPLVQSELLAMADVESKILWDELTLAYTHSQGLPILREEICKLYSNILTEELIIAAPEEAIFIAMNVLINKGDHVVTSFPAYQSLYEIANSLGANISKWVPDQNGHFNPNDLFKLITDDTKLIIMNFPHNPTGETIEESHLIKIVEFAKKRNIIIFSDEMYRLLEYEEKDRLPSVADIYENGISLSGVSKSFSLPGLRIGWLSSQNPSFIKKALEFKDYTTICPPAPSEILALIALRNKDKIVAQNIKTIKGNLELLEVLALKHSKIFNWRKAKAGPVIFLELNIKQKIENFCKDLVEKKGVMLLPASIFAYPQKKARFGLGRKNFEQALLKLDEFLIEQEID
jgi:aspartate/methionine/tyrosine aminotransferase